MTARVSLNHTEMGKTKKSTAAKSTGTAAPTGAESQPQPPQRQSVPVRWTAVLIGLAFACGVVAAWIGANPSAATLEPVTVVYADSPTAADPEAVGQFLAQAMKPGGVLKRGDLESESDPVTARGGRMIMAWQTPIYRVNIASFGKPKSKNSKPFDVTNFNRVISDRVLSYFNTVIEQYKAANGNAAVGKKEKEFVFDASDANNANQIFYEWQKAGGANLLFNTSEANQMFAVGQLAADIMLQTLGQSAEAIKNRPQQIAPWATVHVRRPPFTDHFLCLVAPLLVSSCFLTVLV